MCTLTYLPISNGSFILTSSRDEKTLRRRALRPQADSIGDQMVLYPKDTQGGGTWIATSSTKTVCLLNGAFKAHQPAGAYRHSRGKVVLDVFAYAPVYDFIMRYKLRDIEPFTLIVIEDTNLYEIRWNGKRYYLKTLDAAMPYIWSSVTLYNAGVRKERTAWFKEWLLSTDTYTVETVRLFHKTAGQNDPANSLVMNRNNEVRTVSLTSIIRNEAGTEMIYEDLLSEEVYQTPLYEPAISE